MTSPHLTPTGVRLATLAATLLIGLASCSRPADDYPIDRAIYDQLPFDMEVVRQPSFPRYSVSIADYGAVGDGQTLCHEAINKAIADARASGELKALSEQFFGADISSAS